MQLMAAASAVQFYFKLHGRVSNRRQDRQKSAIILRRESEGDDCPNLASDTVRDLG
jgi:hypothetical protein